MSTAHRPDDAQEAPAPETYPHPGRWDPSLHRALIVIGVTALTAVLVWILWQALNVVLLIFGGILLAVLLRAISDGIKRVTHLPDQVAIGITMSHIG